jgi:hypothetical protein
MAGYIFLMYFVVGTLCLCVPGAYYQEQHNCRGLEFLNPIFLYNTHRINIFGVLFICLFYNLLQPIASIGYWFYKLCTIGRKKED